MSQACLSCGACCANFRVSFYWSETDEHPAGHVPAELTVPISPYHVAMHGTQLPEPRCVALTGQIGQCVSCSIYALRSSTCREFEAGDARCNQARARYNLIPIQPDDDDPDSPQPFPSAA
ncbi:MAG: YkgJ family cysteine cluster protein [Pseudomonadota bacterium]|nr:YkgJ family cysteine cluster protein [Pseudomonadota bacterium]